MHYCYGLHKICIFFILLTSVEICMPTFGNFCFICLKFKFDLKFHSKIVASRFKDPNQRNVNYLVTKPLLKFIAVENARWLKHTYWFLEAISVFDKYFLNKISKNVMFGKCFEFSDFPPPSSAFILKWMWPMNVYSHVSNYIGTYFASAKTGCLFSFIACMNYCRKIICFA